MLKLDTHIDNYVLNEDLQASEILTFLTEKYVYIIRVHNNDLLLLKFGFSTIIIIGILIIILSTAESDIGTIAIISPGVVTYSLPETRSSGPWVLGTLSSKVHSLHIGV